MTTVERARTRAPQQHAPRRAQDPGAPSGTVAVVGLGYVGLPTALLLEAAGFPVLGIDVSERRLEAIARRDVDLLAADRDRLADALGGDRFALSADPAELERADAVVICVPTPVDERRRPDLTALRAACEATVRHARRGQLLVLASTSHVGATRELLIEPLERRGLADGDDVCVAFSPERIDPGNDRHRQETVPRVVGADSAACVERATAVLGPTSPALHVVSSPEAAELTKLHENAFRAVNIAFANEMADASRRLGLDPIEIIEAAATKPYGFLPFYPGPGVGGHCIPCDPHYLLASLGADRESPLIDAAMAQIAARPERVVADAVALLGRRGIEPAGARVLVVGAAYKPGIRDVREAPGAEILRRLAELGAEVGFNAPLVDCLALRAGAPALACVRDPRDEDWDLVVIAGADPDSDYEWLDGDAPVLDCTHRVAQNAVGLG